jgi:SulP family sulfate permease
MLANILKPSFSFKPKLLETLKGYTGADFRADLIAGLVVGLVALPLAMAFAIASGLPPARGIYTAVVAGFVASALGGSRVSISGPTGAFVVIVLGIGQKFGYEGLAACTLIAGVMLLVMGFAKAGDLIKFVPYPVVTGFTAGIAVIIFSGQVKDLFGLSLPQDPSEFIAKWKALMGAWSSISPQAAALGVGTTALIAFWPKPWAKLPGSVVALVLATLAAWYFQLPVATVESRFGAVPQSLPMPSLPHLEWDQMRQLFQPALTVALLAAIESLLCAVVADGMIGDRHDANQELIAQGAANLASPLFGGIPATGAIARTATNVKNGARTPVSGIIHAVTLLLILFAAAPLAGRIPLAALSGVLMVVAYNMSEWRSFVRVAKGRKSDMAVLLVSFLLTVLVDLTVAVEVGLVMAAFLFMRSMAQLTQVRAMLYEGNDEARRQVQGMTVPVGVEIFSVHGTFFFGAASKVLDVVRQAGRKPRVLVLEMRGVLFIDGTGVQTLSQLKRDCTKLGIKLIVSGIHAQPLNVVMESEAWNQIGEENFCGGLDEAFYLARPEAE